jgi:hypothetical protein
MVEIARFVKNLFAVHDFKDVVVKEIRENLYSWRVIRKPGPPAPIDFVIRLGSKTFAAKLETGTWKRRYDGRMALTTDRINKYIYLVSPSSSS